jgi:hypothetical protein
MCCYFEFFRWERRIGLHPREGAPLAGDGHRVKGVRSRSDPGRDSFLYFKWNPHPTFRKGRDYIVRRYIHRILVAISATIPLEAVLFET